MPHFQPIAFLDIWEVAGSMYGGNRMGLFRKDEPSILPLRGPPPGADDPEDELAFGTYRQTWGHWPEMKRLVERLRQIAKPVIGEVDLGLMFLEMLHPGQCLPWELSDSAYVTRFLRLHLAIRTNPRALLYAGGEQWCVQPGQAVITNKRVRHSAVNFGDHPRIHLVLDFKQKDTDK